MTAGTDTTTTDKRKAILATTLDLLVEKGFHATPVSLIAKRSGVSAGIIYHYFASKDDLIRALYAEIKADFWAAFVIGDPHTLAWPDRLKQTWLNTYRFHADRPAITRFLEQYEASPFYEGMASIEATAPTTGPARTLMVMLKSDIETGLMRPLPFDALYAMTFGVARDLATHGQRYDAATLDAIAEACVSAVSATARP